MDKDLQKNWFDLCDRLAPKDWETVSSSEYRRPAERHLAKILRDMADHIESGKMPSVYGYSYNENVGPFTELKIVLSHPWGG